MEVTKWLKPPVSVSRIGDSASVQAVTRVNAEQASKRTMRRPTRRPFRGHRTSFFDDCLNGFDTSDGSGLTLLSRSVPSRRTQAELDRRPWCSAALRRAKHAR